MVQTPSRHYPDTIQTPSRHQPDTTQTPWAHFASLIGQNLNYSGWWFVVCWFVSGLVGVEWGIRPAQSSWGWGWDWAWQKQKMNISHLLQLIIMLLSPAVLRLGLSLAISNKCLQIESFLHNFHLDLSENWLWQNSLSTQWFP